MDKQFLRWLEKVVDYDKRQQFLLADCEERKEWRDWYLQGLSPYEAVQKNEEVYG